jgi:hypothetical protein
MLQAHFSNMVLLEPGCHMQTIPATVSYFSTQKTETAVKSATNRPKRIQDPTDPNNMFNKARFDSKLYKK